MGRRLATLTSGSQHRRVIIAAHGVTDNGASLAGIAAHWNRDWRVVLVDSLGHGLSPRPEASDLDDPVDACASACVHEVEECARTSASGKAVLVGHSMGGAIMTEVAIRRPDLVDALVLEDPAWLAEERHDHRASRGKQMVESVDEVARDPVGAIAKKLRERPNWPLEEVMGWAQGKAQVDRALLRTGVVGLACGPEEIARQIRVPCLIVTGDAPGVIIGGEGLRRIDGVGNHRIRTAVVPGAAHCVRRDRPASFYDLVDRFLERAGLARR